MERKKNHVLPLDGWISKTTLCTIHTLTCINLSSLTCINVCVWRSHAKMRKHHVLAGTLTVRCHTLVQQDALQGLRERCQTTSKTSYIYIRVIRHMYAVTKLQVRLAYIYIRVIRHIYAVTRLQVRLAYIYIRVIRHVYGIVRLPVRTHTYHTHIETHI
jgi:hypothetical protein